MGEPKPASPALLPPVPEQVQMIERSDLPATLSTHKPPIQGPWRKARRILPIAVAGTLLGAVTGGLFLTNHLSANRAAAPSEPVAGVLPAAEEGMVVRTVRPTRVTFRRTTTQPGTVHSFYEAKVYARVTGYLEELKAEIGDPVEEGQVLARIAVPELEKKRERLQAEVVRLQAEQSQAGVEVETARAQVAAAEAQVGQARSELKKAEAMLSAELAECQRIEKVAKSGTLDQGIVNEVQNRYQAALAGRQVAESAVEAAKAHSALAAAKLRAAQANEQTAATRTEVARKEVEELGALIDFATLRAPFRGVVTARGVDLGDLVSSTQKPSGDGGALFTISLLDKLRIRVPIPERDAPFLQEGNPAEFRSEAFPEKVFVGKVSRLASSLETRTRTMLVEVDLPNPDRRLLPGMFGQVRLVLEDRPNRLALPTRAVRHDNGGKGYVLMAGADGKVCRVDVVTGQEDGQRIEVLQGLTGQEQILTVQPPGLVLGQRVRCINEE